MVQLDMYIDLLRNSKKMFFFQWVHFKMPERSNFVEGGLKGRDDGLLVNFVVYIFAYGM